MSKTKALIAAILVSVSAASATAQEWNWNTSIGVTLYGEHGSVSVGANNYPSYPSYGPTVVLPPAPVVVIPPQVPTVVYPPQRVMVIPCYNCGQYPQGDPRDPYRNHHHLQRFPQHSHSHGPSVNVQIHN